MKNNRALSFSGMSVLILDDSDNMCSILARLLRSFGFEDFCFANGGADALQLLQKRRVDLAVVDWHMEGLNGIEFSRHVRARKTSPDPYLPIILLTAFTELAQIKVAQDVGVNEILTKPVSPDALYGRLTSVVRKPRPYIETTKYFGPDRRRKETPEFKGPHRRNGDAWWRHMASASG